MFIRILSRTFRGICQDKVRQVVAQHSSYSSSLGKVWSTYCHTLGLIHVQKLQESRLNGQRRHFWGIDVAFNKVDEERVRLAGSDRAAAEWVLRNGGAIKWTTSTYKLNDYNLLPSTNFEVYKLEEIDLTTTNVIGLGFEHLKDLQDLKAIKLHGCRTIMDDALGHLHFVKNTLQHLEISRCPMITEKGLMELTELKKLKSLILYDLIEISNFETVVSKLRKSMPWCKIDTTDPEVSPSEHN